MTLETINEETKETTEKKVESLFLEDTTEKVYKKDIISNIENELKKENRTFLSTDVPKNIRFSQKDGRLQVQIPSYGTYPISNIGFERLCKILKAPARFFRQLPFENIQKDLSVQTLNTNYDRINFIIKNNVITGVSVRDFDVSPKDVLEKVLQNNSLKIIEGGYFNGNVFINYTNSENTPIINDSFQYGLSIICDDTGKDNPHLDTYLYRLICANGALAREYAPFQRFSNKQNKDSILDVISDKIQNGDYDLSSNISDSLSNMKDQLIPQDEKKYLQYYLKRSLDFKNRDDGKSRFQQEIVSKEASYYDLMNFITDYAKGFDLYNKRKLEILAGNMLPAFKEVNPHDEIFHGYAEIKRKAMRKEIMGDFED
jgi:hypothetical protein